MLLELCITDRHETNTANVVIGFALFNTHCKCFGAFTAKPLRTKSYPNHAAIHSVVFIVCKKIQTLVAATKITKMP